MKVFFVKLAFLALVLIVIPVILILILNNNNTKDSKIISVYDESTKKIMKLNLEDYIINVVASEMPASFSEEALKAQSVAARTYAIRKVNKDAPEHNGADLCTNYAHCQAYSHKSVLKDNWGKNYSSNIAKIKKCVEATKGMYLSYNGSPANCVFHSCSDGKTENAADVWGGAFSYLVSVESPGDIEKKDFITEVSVPCSEFLTKLKSEFESFGDVTELSIGDVTLSEGGNVNYVTICNQSIKGTDIRRIFGLKSTAFTAVCNNSTVTFTVRGNGHGVGMSQYGANYMAKCGNSFSEILFHYYPGTKLETEYKLS